jgi:hypothetical protein
MMDVRSGAGIAELGILKPKLIEPPEVAEAGHDHH